MAVAGAAAAAGAAAEAGAAAAAVLLLLLLLEAAGVDMLVMLWYDNLLGFCVMLLFLGFCVVGAAEQYERNEKHKRNAPERRKTKARVAVGASGPRTLVGCER